MTPRRQALICWGFGSGTLTIPALASWRRGVSFLPFVATAIACWPVWPWYVARLGDSGDDAAALVALALLAVLPGRAAVASSTTSVRALLPSAIALAAYAASFPLVPRLASALLAFLALGFAWSLWRHGTPFRPWAVGLLLLGLPMASSLQFYLGYPLRIASGAVALVMLRVGGALVERQGVTLRAGGELVMIDAPCSGVRMLWAALLLACCLAALFRLRARASLLAVGAAAILAIAGNGLRTAALFWADTNAPGLPAYSHAGIGVAAFAMLAGALFAIARALQVPSPRALQVPSPLSEERVSVRGPAPSGAPSPVEPSARRALPLRGRGEERRSAALYVLVCALAAAAPLLPRRSHADPAAAATAFAWPARFEGRLLTELPLGERDRRFAADFPGRVGRFSDGTREIIMRFTTQATRRLHPASDCLKAIGFAIDPLPARRGPDGSAWGCFAARKQGGAMTVCEQIRDATGRAWPEPSSWYWPALTGSSQAPWWSTTIVETQPPRR